MWLGRALARLPAAGTISDIEDILAEIDERAELVAREARRISMLKTLRDFDLGFFALSFSVASQAPTPARALVAGLLGGTSLLDLLRKIIERRAAEDELRRSGFYIPWILREAGSAHKAHDGNV